MAGEGNMEVVQKREDHEVIHGDQALDHHQEPAAATKKEVDGGEEEEAKSEVEPKTGVAFPIKLDDGKHLAAVGIRRKKILALGINIYAFGMYAENSKLKELLRSKKLTTSSVAMASKEMYEAVIDGDVETTVRLVIVFGALTMSMVRKNFGEGLGGSVKRLNGGRNDDKLVNMVMGAAQDSIKLSPGSIIEISRLPGYVLETKVKGEVISKVESELLCRAYLDMYLGEEPFDKEAKDMFGGLLLSLL